ncbi:MAG: phosphatase PAP2 family protein [Clostridia bacterium]|nr:phosphatase PAP2 family protein [Clostridia bacterium]
MEFLRFLEGLRAPWLTEVMLVITAFGEELLFMAVAVILFWCVNKYLGYYMLSVGFIGIQLNQLGKVLFRIDRPWVRDPSFHAVENAIPEATGYSFPSGHTQNAVGTFGTVARWIRVRWVRIALWTLAVLVAFSRMYLGVHTPADVVVSFAVAAVLIFALFPVFKDNEGRDRRIRVLMIAMLVWSAAQIAFMELFPFPATADAEQLYHGLENAYKIGGAAVGFAVSFELDRRYVRFDTKAVWWAQIIKVALGLGLALGLKELGYAVFGFIPYAPVVKALAYLLMVLFVGCVWPMTFRLFTKLGKREA